MVHRIYVEKKAGFDHEAQELLAQVRDFLGVQGVEKIRILNRYDIEDIDEKLFYECVKTVFSEPQTDTATEGADLVGARTFAVEYLNGQFDQRADSAAQCIQLVSKQNRPIVRTAKLYAVYGSVTEKELTAIKRYVIDPLKCREGSLAKSETLKNSDPVPFEVETLYGFLDLDTAGLAAFVKKYDLAMDEEDIRLCQDYFKGEDREPTITEIRVLDTYWSERCRNSAFTATIDGVKFEDELLQSAFQDYLAAREELESDEAISLTDIGTIACKLLKKRGMLDKLDQANGHALKIEVTVDGKDEDWLLSLRNESQNGVTEAVPFGGAIRDPLSDMGYAYAAMRVTGGADPLCTASETAAGKLSQRKLAVGAADGASAYCNQYGIAAGQVDEIYHEGYAARRLETTAVLAAAPAEQVRREAPVPEDKVILIGGRTGRDGFAAVQSGNASEARKLQRLFRNKRAARLMKRCVGLGAGGFAVALVGLADGTEIDLNAVPQTNEGLDGTELALSESRERMAVAVDPDTVQEFIWLAEKENLEATVIGTVTRAPRLVMNLNGNAIVNLPRELLHSNGAEKYINVIPATCGDYRKTEFGGFREEYRHLAGDLNVCSKRGLSERFDSTVGAGTVLMPFGGKYQATPPQATVHLLPVEKGHTDTVTYMAWGGNPHLTEKSPYHGAYLAVVESVSKLIASGADFKDVYLSFAEYYLKAGNNPSRLGQPFAALLGAFKAQTELGVAALGGHASMDGTSDYIDVPPTFLSFAVTTGKVRDVVPPEFKGAGHKVVLLAPEYDENGLPVTASLLRNFRTVTNLLRLRGALSVFTLGYGGAAEGVLKSCLGNKIGFRFADGVSKQAIFGYYYGAFVIELEGNEAIGIPLGVTTREAEISYRGERIPLGELRTLYEEKLESVYGGNPSASDGAVGNFEYPYASTAACNFKCEKPNVLIPVFPGTSGEYDAAKAFADAGAKPEIFVVRNRTQDEVAQSAEKFASLVRDSQIVFIPGGYSGGDEPNGAGKLITAFFRGAQVRTEIEDLLNRRDGLMGGIGNGFQALLKLGLVPYGKIIETDGHCPTLAYNEIGRHRSRIARVRVASVKSPWLTGVKAGEIVSVPVSCGEGRFVAEEDLIKELARNGQIMTQYVDLDGNATMDGGFNPTGSAYAIEGILSPDGRVFGKMGHSERKGFGLYKNVLGEYDMRLFESAVKYYK